MVEYIKAVAVKAVGTASVTFLAGFAGEGVLVPGFDFEAAVAVGARTALVGALVSVVIPAMQKVAAKAAATDIPKV